MSLENSLATCVLDTEDGLYRGLAVVFCDIPRIVSKYMLGNHTFNYYN
jgi:hypothetical protein